MADINLPAQFPRGIGADSIADVRNIEFMKNMKIGCLAAPFKVGKDGNDQYKFLIDAQQTLNAVYFVKVRIDDDVTEFIISANARRSSHEGNESFQNTLRIMSATNPGIIYLEKLELKAALSTNVGIVATIKAKSAVSPDIEVIVSAIGTSVINASSNPIDYTVNIPTSVVGLQHEVEVFDDSDKEIDLNSYRRSGIIRCRPASEASRPNLTGNGVCFVAASDTGEEIHQVFLAEEGTMHFRTIGYLLIGSWNTIFAASTYPRTAATGRFFVSLTGNSVARIPISGMDIDYDRHSIIVSPENDLSEVASNLEIDSRGKDYFDVKTSNKWDGTINWTIIENYAPNMAPVYNLTVGRLDGGDMRPADSVNEGQTIRVVLSTQNVSNGTIVPFVISGVTQNDIGIPLSGQFVVKNSSAYVDITVLDDYISDGDKELKISIVGADVSATMAIRDTSTDPIFDIFFTSDKEAKNRISKLDSGYIAYLNVTAVGYRPGVEYELDFTGSTLDLNEGVLNPIPDRLKFTFTSNLYQYPIFLNPLKIEEQVINITDTTDVVLYDLYKAKYGIPTKPVNVRFLIPSGKTIIASRTSVAAIRCGQFPSNSIVSLDNYGTVMGRGGDGGYVEFTGQLVGLDGGTGGPAVDMDSTSFLLTFNNYGYIYSGGGGGGASASTAAYDGDRQVWSPASGGLGGAPYGKTLPMSRVRAENCTRDLFTGKNTASFWVLKTVDGLYNYMFYDNVNAVWSIRRNGATIDYQTLRPFNFDATMTSGAKTDPASPIFIFYAENSYTVNPGSGGNPGEDGTSSYTNTPHLGVRGGVGGKAGFVFGSNRKNVVLRNISGIVKGH